MPVHKQLLNSYGLFTNCVYISTVSWLALIFQKGGNIHFSSFFYAINKVVLGLPKITVGKIILT